PFSQAPFVAKLDGGGQVLWARPTSAACQGALAAVSAAGGRVWTTGPLSGTCDFSAAQNMPVSGDILIASLDPGGAFRGGASLVGGPEGAFNFATLGGMPDGSVVVAGAFQGTVDFDPGPGVVRRAVPATTTTGQSGFALRLSSAGAFIWATSIVDAP